MDQYEELEHRLKSASSMDQANDVLSDLFIGGYAVWTDDSLYNIKQLVENVNGLQIHVYGNEHAPPHFHVKSGDVDASFTIQDGTLMHGDIDSRKKRLVLWWYQRSRPLLVKAWNTTRPSDCPVGPIVE